jgi:hypothetical protein
MNNLDDKRLAIPPLTFARMCEPRVSPPETPEPREAGKPCAAYVTGRLAAQVGTSPRGAAYVELESSAFIRDIEYCGESPGIVPTRDRLCVRLCATLANCRGGNVRRSYPISVGSLLLALLFAFVGFALNSKSLRFSGHSIKAVLGPIISIIDIISEIKALRSFHPPSLYLLPFDAG